MGVKRKTPVVIMFRFVSGYPGPRSLLSFQTQLVISLDADSFDDPGRPNRRPKKLKP